MMKQVKDLNHCQSEASKTTGQIPENNSKSISLFLLFLTG